jgi:hypothetical protein
MRIRATGDEISQGKVYGSIITRTEHVDQTVNKTAWGRPKRHNLGGTEVEKRSSNNLSTSKLSGMKNLRIERKDHEMS